jgi:glycosyltransferase involved in cell wall biosynthesis
MSVSVIMPNFNHAKWLPRAVQSLLTQSEPPQEIIIVDDASTDNSVSVIEWLASKHPSIRLVRHKKNLGVVAGMISGFAAAKGEFAFSTASDDFYFPELLKRATAALRANPQAGLFCAGVVMVDSENNILGFRPFAEPSQTARYMSPLDVRKLILNSDNWILGTTVIYRREHLLATSGFDTSLGSFSDGLVVRNLALRHGFYFDPEILAAWMVYPESFSASSALSATKTRALIDSVRQRSVQIFPEDIGDRYSDLIARRLRFSMSRLSLVYAGKQSSTDGALTVFGDNPTDQRVLRILARVPFVNRTAMLGWMFLRTRPFSLRSVVKSWWNHFRLDSSRRTRVSSIMAEMSAALKKMDV